MVPTLDDDGFVLTESSAILKYLADKMHPAAYPKGLRERAKVNEMMDWFNTQFYREYGYSFVYPQTFQIHKLEPEEGLRNLVARGKERATFPLRRQCRDGFLVRGDLPHLRVEGRRRVRLRTW